MKTLLLSASAVLCIAASSARAGFHTGQRADLSLGALSPSQRLVVPWGVAVDPVTHKVFVADYDLNRVLRFSSTQSLTNGGTAEAVLGQPDMDSTAPPTAGTLAMRWGLRNPAGIAVDSQGRLWVADSGNHRVLRFDNAATRLSGTEANAVFGQPGFTSALTGVQANRMQTPTAVVVSAGNTVWVADTGNHRVLRFRNLPPPEVQSGFAADCVLGQTDFVTPAPAATAISMNSPSGLALEEVISHGTSATQRLWVADSGNSRVLRFELPNSLNSGAAAAAVLGQSSFTGSAPSLTAFGMAFPRSLAVMSGGLWVADPVFNRVTLFLSAGTKASGAPADRVLGQPHYASDQPAFLPGRFSGPVGVAVDGARLWTSDSSNQRVTCHENAGAAANGAFESGQIGQPGALPQPPPGASWLGPGIPGMAIDPVSSKLFVCDLTNNRVLRFSSVRSLTTGAAAEAVLGQPDFSSSSPGATASRMNTPSAAVMDYFGHLWVADRGNNRVLRFDNAATLPGGSAAVHVLGQINFTANASGTTSTTLKSPAGLALEFVPSLNATPPVARLWVADSFNHRVLRFESPLTIPSGGTASGVLGQALFNTSFAATLPQPDGLNFPRALCAGGGRLWVADEFNNRVLRFDNAGAKPNGGSADGVLLQSDFTSGSSGNSQTTGNAPAGLSLSPAGRLFIADRDNHRVLWFDNAASRINGASANGVLGQANFTANGLGVGWNALYTPQACLLDPGTGRLWIGDSDNRRVLRFSPDMESSLNGFNGGGSGSYTISVRARVGEKVELRSSPDLVDWNTVEATLTAANDFVSFLNMNVNVSSVGPRRYFRLQLP